MIKRTICATAGLIFALGQTVAQAQTAPQPVAKPIGPAVDWNLRGFARQRFEFDSNRQLDADSEGAIYGSLSTLGLRLDARTKRSLLSLNAGVTARVFGGPGDTDNLSRFDPEISASHVYAGKDYSISNGLSLDVRPTTETQFEDSGIVEDQANQFTFAYNTGYTQSINARNSWSLSGDVRVIRFDEDVDGLAESERVGVNTSWQHALSQTTSVFASSGFRYFNSDNETTSQTVDFTTGVNHQRTSRHNFGATGGFSVVRIEDGDAPGEPTEVNVGFNGGASFDYAIQRFNAGIDFSQRIDPSSSGDVDAFTRLSGALSYQLTPFSTLSGNLNFTRRTAISDADAANDPNGQFLSLGPRFTTRLTDDVNLSLGYLFRLDADEDSDIGTGHQLFLTISKNFEVIE
ncbi:MAG: hypothetical protein AAGC81_14810 [Pseudomonadota bacterium]